MKEKKQSAIRPDKRQRDSRPDGGRQNPGAPQWNGFGLAVLFFFAVFVTIFPLTNSDIWWHLASAREMFSGSGFLRADPFAYTSNGEPWINIHWGFQCLVYGIFKTWGVEGMVAFKALVYGLSVILAARAVPSAGFGFPGLVFAGAAAYLGRYLVLARPTTLTLLFMAVFVFFLERYRRNKNQRLLGVLLILQILWANVQGLFILGPVLVLIYGLEEIRMGNGPLLAFSRPFRARLPVLATQAGGRTRGGNPGPNRKLRKFAFPLIACAPLFWLVSAIHPYGLSVLGYPFKLFGRINSTHANLYSDNVSENLPLLSLVKDAPGMATAFLLMATLVGITMAAGGRSAQQDHQRRPAHWMLFFCFLILALLAKRNLILFCLVGVPLFTAYAPALLERVKPHLPRVSIGAAKALAWILLIWMTLTHASVLSRSPSNSFVSPFRFPEEAVGYLQRHPVPGNIFNSVRHGGYLLWERYPPHTVLIDGRLILRTPEFFAEYLAILDHPPLFEGVRKKFNITHVLLPIAVFERYRELAKFLYREPDWRLVWTDGTAVLFVLNSLAETPELKLENPETLQAVRKAVTRKWNRDPYLRKEALEHLENMVSDFTGRD